MANIIDIKEAIYQANMTQTAELSTKFDEINKSIETINNRIDSVVNEFESHVRKTDFVVAGLQNKIALLEDKFARRDRADQVIIRNVPMASSENVIDIFTMICTQIGCAAFQPMPLIRRFINKLPRMDDSINVPEVLNPAKRTRSYESRIKNNAQTEHPKKPIVHQAPSILVTFMVPHNKFLFMNAYFAFKNLNLSCIGFSSTDRIIIRDNLTQRNHQIFIEASKMKAIGIIKKIRMRDGLVSVITTNNQTETVTDMLMLNKIKDNVMVIS